VVVVDEMSMVSLSLMAKLVEAVRSDARLVLVGDPEQLASIEAGAVLGDIVGPAADGLLMRPPARLALAAATGHEVAPGEAPAGGGIGDGIVVLRHVHRYGGAIAALAEAVRQGDADAALEVLGSETDDVRWVPVDVAALPNSEKLRPLRSAAVGAGRRMNEAARAGQALAAIDALGELRLLCAHRRGPHGVSTWGSRIETWLTAEIEGFAAEGPWYVGRPLLVTKNDYGLHLYNGDTGVVVASGGGRIVAAFERRGELLEVSPTRLAAVDSVYAMTVHKSQGSQFDTVAVLLPDSASPILTRELLYTAVTRARRGLILVGTPETVRAAIERPIARASGLRRWLWDAERSLPASEAAG
jgi:exodeoxyribonuclease V alpha subunit